MAKPKILVITHNYPRHDSDMAGVFIKNLISDLSNHFEFKVCHIYYGGLMKDLFKNPLNWPRLADYYSKSMQTAQAELDSDKFDLIWAHWWLPGGIIGARLAGNNDIPLMVTMHGTDAAMLKSVPIIRPVANYVFKRSSIVNTVSKYLASVTTSRAHVANMPYDPAVFNYGGKEKDEKLIICPARLDKGKNIDLLVKAVRQVPEMKLKIFGEGPERDSIAQLIGDDPRIELHEYIPQKQLADEYQKAGVIALPSSVEGFGLVLAEGAACGCFPIATQAASMTEIVEQIGGELFDLDSEATGIKNTLTRYLSSLPINRQKISEKASVYGKDEVLPRFVEMINHAIKSPPDKGQTDF